MIVKSLNLNRTPKDLPNGSMVFAQNMKISDDGSYLTNEEGIKLTLPAKDSDGADVVGGIVGVIPCNDELVLFTYDYTNGNSQIYRYYEKNEELHAVKTVWNYSGGDRIVGTYTYNVNHELIVCFGESDSNNNPKIPLKTINLSRTTKGDESRYNVAPNIPVCNFNLRQKVAGCNIPNGIYYFFIRYKIDDDYYTNWHPIGVPHFAMQMMNENIVNHRYEINGNQKTTNTVCFWKYNRVDLDCGFNFEFEVEFNKTYDYKGFQLGYILQHNNATYAREWKTFSFNTKRIVFNAANSTETTIDALTKSTFNIYNVKSICNFENKVYIGNFDETDNNPNLQKFADVIMTWEILKSNVSTITNKDVASKETRYTFSMSGNNNKYIIVFTGDNLVKTNYLVKLTDNERLCEILAEYLNVEVQWIKIYGFKYFNTNEKGKIFDVASEDVYVDFNKSYLDFCDSNGKSYFSSSLPIYFVKSIASDGFTTSNVRLILNQFSISKTFETTRVSSDTIYYETSKTLMPNQVYNFFVHYVRDDGTCTNGYKIPNWCTTTNNELYMIKTDGTQTNDVTLKLSDLKTFYSNSPYDSNGAKVYNYIDYSDLCTTKELKDKYVYEVTSNNISSSIRPFGYYVNENGDKLFRTGFNHLTKLGNSGNKQIGRIGVGFTRVIIPEGYVGCFFSYEKVEDTNNYLCLCENATTGMGIRARASDVECGAVNYNCTILVPEYSLSSNYLMNPLTAKAVYVQTCAIMTSNKPGSFENADDDNTVGKSGCIVLNTNGVYRLNSDDKYVVCSAQTFNRNIYSKNVKELIPFGPVIYRRWYEGTGLKYSYADNDGLLVSQSTFDQTFSLNRAADMEFNYDSFYSTDKVLDYPNRVYISDEGKVYDISEDNEIGTTYTSHIDNYAKLVRFAKCSHINIDSISIKKKPETIVGVIGDASSSTHTKTISTITRPINATDLIELKDTFKQKQYKAYTNFQNDLIYNGHKSSTIRRSDTLADDVLYNAWKHFDVEEYKVIDKNRGSITNLFGLGDNLYIHCEYGLFVLDKSSSLQTENKSVKLGKTDLFDMDAREIFSTKLGYAGMCKFDNYCINEYGYFFYDAANYVIYNYDNNQLYKISDDVERILRQYNIKYILFVTDQKNHRLILSCGSSKYFNTFSLSYHLRTKKFVSTHCYGFKFVANTTNGCYLFSQSEQKVINGKVIPYFNYMGCFGVTGNEDEDSTNRYDHFIVEAITEKEPWYPFRNVGHYYDCVVDFIFNENYDEIKVIDSINYIFTLKEMKSRNWDEQKFGEPITVNKLSGDKLRIYTDQCDTLDTNIAVDEKYKKNLNLFTNTKLPFFNKGRWQFNYIRDRINVKYKSTQEETYKSDNMSLVYGKYFVVRFKFDDLMNHEMRIEDVNINTSSY